MKLVKSGDTIMSTLIRENIKYDFLTPNKLSEIVSNEEYECVILSPCFMGQIILPNETVHAPVEAKYITIVDNRISIKNINILEVSESVTELQYSFEFELQFFDKDFNILKIICETSLYPLPGDKTTVKESLSVKTEYHRKIFGYSDIESVEGKAIPLWVHGKYTEDKKQHDFYDIDDDPYLEINVFAELITCIKEYDEIYSQNDFYFFILLIILVFILYINDNVGCCKCYTRRECYI